MRWVPLAGEPTFSIRVGNMTTFPPVEYTSYPSPQQGAPIVVLIHGFAATAEQVWVKTGWIRKLQAQGLHCITVDLPYHGQDFLRDDAQSASTVQSIEKSALPAEGKTYTAAVEGALFRLSQQVGHPLHVVGFSAGARIAWEFAIDYPENVRTVTVAGFPQKNHIEDLKNYLSGRQHEAIDTVFRQLIDQSPITTEGLLQFVSAPHEGEFDPAQHHPKVPTLVVGGTADTVSGSGDWLYEALEITDVPHRREILSGRDHINALTSGIFKKAVMQWIQKFEP